VDITAFIRELLFSHDCVILPGFGGFIGNYTPARIDREAGTFYPPVKQISFNRNLNNNDGLLIGKISATSGTNYGDSRTLVENFVSDLRRKLVNGEKIVFDHIGTFINNPEGNVLFEPDRNVNYHLDSYGLESFQCLPLEGYDVRTRVMKYGHRDPAKQVLTKKLLWRAAVIVPLLSVMLAVPLRTDRIQTTTLNPLVTAEFDHNKKALEEEAFITESPIGETIETDTPVAEAVIPVATEEIPTAEPVAPAIIESSARMSGYYLITGSFQSEENAVTHVARLNRDGYTAEIHAAPNGFYRVSAMVCPDLNTAVTKKDSISKKYPETWVSRKR
jgi:nucleoid DNA-binding protein